MANRCERSWHKDWWCPDWEPSDWDPSEWFHIGRRFFRLGRELTNVVVNGRPAREILDFDEQCVRCASWNVKWHTVGLGFGGECLSCRAVQPETSGREPKWRTKPRERDNGVDNPLSSQ